MKSPLDPRHKKRQKLMQELFKYDFRKQPISKETKEILLKLDLIDKTITLSAKEFPIEKINRTDLAILRLAIYELMIEKKEPPKVIIDEAIELAKEFGGETSPSFVNGVLGKVISHD